MTYLAPLIILSVLIGTLVWLRFKAARALSAETTAAPQFTERQLSTELIAGTIAPADYQRAMADIAHRTDQPVAGVETGVLTGAQGDPRAQLAMLGVALPEVSPSLLCWAFVMVQNGADAATLVHTLNLTPWQAATIAAGTRR
ncbi:hypothetical protein DMH04_18070 [Kibdelosporangium aridum]|uniref:Uncharacterized protein n=1 Tax=Kibdelosporangium aridum TaxID=2030 RepID=A0A428ZAX7_KIBAR|nr:hypothetical protein [Kibdelosporangium aridum]RSM85206.1 hypothetical protein DMH04_18070 [Kibdelosporangium aridum]